MKTFIIAEAGVNHNGSLELAKKLIDVAKTAGADAVKFQTFKAKNLVSKNAKKAEYQLKTTNNEETQFDMIKKLELSFEDFEKLKEYCDKKEIMFLSTPFDIESTQFLKALGLEIFKIPSGEITNYLLLKEIGSYKQKVILSTGMADLGEIEDALDLLIENGTKREDITILHSNTEYPTPFEDVNLKAINTIECAFKVDVGYSDHTLGIEVPIAAVAMGAKVIEKHFTLDKDMQGPDHKASLEPDELEKMIKAIRNIEKALGNGIKKPSKSEIKNKNIVRKSIVAKRDIKKGEIFSENNLTIKRPGDGISPMRWKELVGKKSLRDIKVDEAIRFGDFSFVERKKMGKNSKFIECLKKALRTNYLRECFTAKDLKEAFKKLGNECDFEDNTFSNFLSKHREGNSGRYKEYFEKCHNRGYKLK